MENMNQLDLRQTGVARVLCNNGVERIIPMFSKNVVEEAYTLLKEGKIQRVLELYSYINQNYKDNINKLDARGLLEDVMSSIRNTFKRSSNTLKGKLLFK